MYSNYSNPSNYNEIINFGCNSKSATTNPLSYCAVNPLESGFNHTLGYSYITPQSEQCQIFMGDYCANKWDGICEYLSHNHNIMYPNMLQNCNNPSGSTYGTGLGNRLTEGQILIRNTAAAKYLKYMSGNCTRVYQPDRKSVV